MDRKEQLNILKDIPTWEEPEINIYESAYYVNYKNLDNMINNISNYQLNDNRDRLKYLIFTQQLNSIYSQISLVYECLMKHMLYKYGYSKQQIIKIGHSLEKLFLELNSKNNITSENDKEIILILNNHKDIFKDFDTLNVFVNFRYCEYLPSNYSSIEPIENLILDLDKIFGLSNLESHFFKTVYATPL